MKINPSIDDKARDTLLAAERFLDRLDHANAVRVMTNFLHNASPKDCRRGEEPLISPDSLIICIACGGSAKRWANFLQVPKHLVDIGKSDSLLGHTVEQILRRIHPLSLKAVVSPETRNLYKEVGNIEIIERTGDPDEDVALEILANPSLGLDESKDLLLIMGDVAFTNKAMDVIAYAVNDRSRLRLFGRSRRNPQYGNTGGEIFGAYIPGRELSNIKVFYETCKKIYYGTARLAMYRFSTWEVLALVTAAGKKSGEKTLSAIQKHSYSLREIVPMMKSALDQGEFLESIWHEIDDETEDFDFPCEYINWLTRSVASFI